MKPTIIRHDDTIEEIYPANGTDFQLEELQAIVGGSIECVWPRDGTVITLNGEGKLEGLPINLEATKVVLAVLAPDDYIVGNVLHCPASMIR